MNTVVPASKSIPEALTGAKRKRKGASKDFYCETTERKYAEDCWIRLNGRVKMGEHLVPVLLITANVGSVFENVSNLNKSYVFFSKVTQNTTPWCWLEYVRILFKILPVSSKCNLSLIDHIAQVDMLSFAFNQIVLK